MNQFVGRNVYFCLGKGNVALFACKAGDVRVRCVDDPHFWLSYAIIIYIIFYHNFMAIL